MGTSRKHPLAHPRRVGNYGGISRMAKRCEMIHAPTIAETAEFIRLNPLPAYLAHLEADMLKIPLKLLTDLIIGGAQMEVTADQLATGLKAAAAFYSLENHHCGACFAWTDNEHAFAAIVDGDFRFGACCNRCRCRIDNGTATRTMHQNM